MKDSLESLKRKITGAGDLGSVVRTMKALAASSITQYENAVQSLDIYYRTIELGLALSFRQSRYVQALENKLQKSFEASVIIVFGSDQGLVGQFNEIIAEFVTNQIRQFHGKKSLWTVGERIYSHLENAGLPCSQLFTLPNSVNKIASFVGQILTKIETYYERNENTQFYIFHNRPRTGSFYEPARQCLIPLDEVWRHELTQMRWPTKYLPEIIGNNKTTQQALVREYLFVSLFRTCAESLASENASRLAAMQRAEKNIKELLEDLHLAYHQLRQSAIDEELFDVISGSEALSKKKSG